MISGTVLGLITALAVGLLGNWEVAIQTTGGIGVVSWLLAGILSGAFISCDRTRANESIETADDKRFRIKFSSLLFLLGLPFLVTALFMYLITK